MPGITLLGLGPGDPDKLTREAWDVLTSAGQVWLRTKQHPTVASLPPALAIHSFDELYENGDSFDEVYSRILRGIGNEGDVLIAISTSGNSGNIIRALETARGLGIITVGLTGSTGGKMKDLCKLLVNVPSDDTPRIQESHILIGHIICENVESILFKR